MSEWEQLSSPAKENRGRLKVGSKKKKVSVVSEEASVEGDGEMD